MGHCWSQHRCGPFSSSSIPSTTDLMRTTAGFPGVQEHHKPKAILLHHKYPMPEDPAIRNGSHLVQHLPRRAAMQVLQHEACRQAALLCLQCAPSGPSSGPGAVTAFSQQPQTQGTQCCTRQRIHLQLGHLFCSHLGPSALHRHLTLTAAFNPVTPQQMLYITSFLAVSSCVPLNARARHVDRHSIPRLHWRPWS